VLRLFRPHVVAGNWKMHKGVGEAESFVRQLEDRLEEPSRRDLIEEDLLEVVIYPTALCVHSCLISRSSDLIQVGAQNGHWEIKGAYTGEVSIGSFAEEGCGYILIGHSERRSLFGETDQDVRRKVEAVMGTGAKAMVCVGELLSEREEGRTFQVVGSQVRSAVNGLPEEFVSKRLTIAYEPVWAIGTGRTASASDAQEVCAHIRGILKEIFGPQVANGVRILYGGSVKRDNTFDILKEPDVDGLLVGGASLEVDSFLGIVDEAIRAMGAKGLKGPIK
jgi:triosephosphate isomerase